VTLGCRLLGHRYRFTSEGPVMRWRCERGCGAAHEKRYATPEEAAHFARAFDREDREDLGRRPLLSLLPLSLARRMKRSGAGTARSGPGAGE